LAAHRAGIRHVIMPKKNEKDLREIPASVQVCNVSYQMLFIYTSFCLHRLNYSLFLFQLLMMFCNMLLMWAWGPVLPVNYSCYCHVANCITIIKWILNLATQPHVQIIKMLDLLKQFIERIYIIVSICCNLKGKFPTRGPSLLEISSMSCEISLKFEIWKKIYLDIFVYNCKSW